MIIPMHLHWLKPCLKKGARCAHTRTRIPAHRQETKVKSAKETGKQKASDSHCATDEETGDGSEQSSNGDQDSDVSFHVIEEEWIEFIKRMTKRCRRTY